MPARAVPDASGYPTAAQDAKAAGGHPRPARTVPCGVCERPITAPPGVEVALCRDCAQHPVLVAAFREGRARLFDREVEAHHATVTVA